MNPRKAVCGERNEKFKYLSKKESKLFRNALVILHS